MSQVFNIYCDESCHLENDGKKVMVIGAVWCKKELAEGSARRLREIKKKHKLSGDFEVKWTKVSASKVDFYQDYLDYFFDDDDLHFRGVVIQKTGLRHGDFGQSHDTWYYKMFFTLIEPILAPKNHYYIYLDIKDTRSQGKVKKLHEVLANKMYDFDRSIVKGIQQVRSHHVEQVQLADLLIGALGYANRGMGTNQGKCALIERIKQRSKYSLLRKTLLCEQKFNIFHWNPRSTE